MKYKGLLYLGIGILVFILVLKVFWPLLWVLFIVYILYSMYKSYVLSKDSKQNGHDFHQSSNRNQHKNNDIIDVDYTEVIENEE